MLCPGRRAIAGPRGDRARRPARRRFPGLKMVWLAPWGDVAKAHPWRNIIVHQTEGPAGSARGGALAQSKNPTRRGVTVWVETDGTVYWAVPETSGSDPWRRRQPQRQQIHRQRPDLSPGDRRHFDRGGIRRQLSRRDARRHRGADRGVADPGQGAARALRHSARVASMRITGSTSRTRAIAKAARWRRWRGSGESRASRRPDADLSSTRSWPLSQRHGRPAGGELKAEALAMRSIIRAGAAGRRHHLGSHGLAPDSGRCAVAHAAVLAASDEPSKPFLEKNSFYLSSAGFRIQVANDPAGKKRCACCRRIASS